MRTFSAKVQSISLGSKTVSSVAQCQQASPLAPIVWASSNDWLNSCPRNTETESDKLATEPLVQYLMARLG